MTAKTRPIRPVHVGRQAIYDRDGEVVAYELLFRDTPEALAASDRGSHATTQVIVAAFSDFGIDELVGDRACFVNVTREFVVGELPLPFDASRVGIELLSDVVVDDDVLAGVQTLAEQGYTIAVDYSDADRGQDSLLPYATYVKIDMLGADEGRTRRSIDRCARHPHVQLIAERLETPDDVHTAMSMGFALFQGHGLGRPHVVRGNTVEPARVQRVRLLVELNSGEVDLRRVARIIEQDPALAVRILRVVNSAASGQRRTVESVLDAVTLIGARQLQQWTTLMLMTDAAGGDEAGLVEVLARAQFCRTLAEHRGVAGDPAFTAGLLTGMAELLAVPVERLTASLPLGADLEAALTGGGGPLAGVVAATASYVSGTPVADVTADLAATMASDMLDAIRWANAAARPVAGRI